MANIPISAPDLIFNLRVKVQRIRDEQGTHPADVNALLCGVIDGLSVGSSSIKRAVFTDYGSEIVILLEAYENWKDKSLHRLVEMTNSRVFFNEVVRVEDFAKLSSYGTSKSAKYYRMGFEMALSWAIKLYYCATSNELSSERARQLALIQLDFNKGYIQSSL